MNYLQVFENEFEPRNICGSCTVTVLNFNNLMKVFQDTEEELKKLHSSDQKIEIEDDNVIPENTIEKMIIETYHVENQNEDSNNSCTQQIILDSGAINTNEASYFTDKSNMVNLENSTRNFDVIRENNLTNSTDLTKSINGTEIMSKKYSCDECGDVFLIKSGFSHHMFQKHNICIPVENYHQYSSDVKIKLPKDCTDKAFKFVQKLPSQSGRKYRFQCQICKEGFEVSTDLKLHYNIHRTCKCEQCGAAFIKNSYLKDHMLMHTAEKKYVCDVCGKAFKYRNGLSVHKTVHVNHRAHICEACGQGFNARTTLITHMRLKHSLNERKYACSECDLVFKVKSWLDKHFQRKHTKNRTKDFVCSVCGIAYLNKYTLTRHVNDKHLGNGKRHFCHVCDKSYTMKNKLITHMQNKHNIVLSQ